MEALKNINELRDAPTSYKQVFQNNFTNSIDKTKIVSNKYNGTISDLDVVVAEFLFKFRYGTIEQIDKYLKQKKLINEDTTLVTLKQKLDKLVSIHRVLNKFILTPNESEPIKPGDLEFYCLDIGGAFLLHNFTDQPLEKIRNWRPKVANLHTVESIYRDYFVLELYLKLLDIFNEKLIGFEPYKRMSYDKRQMTVTFDFCVDDEGVNKYFIGELIRVSDVVSKARFAPMADDLEQIVSTNAWKKYYIDTDKPPITLFFVEDDELANELAPSIAERKIDRFRITTLERATGDLSTAFMQYDKEEKQLRLGMSKLFKK